MDIEIGLDWVSATRIIQMFVCHAAGISFIANFARYPKKTNIIVMTLVFAGSIAIGLGAAYFYSDIMFVLSYLVTMSLSIGVYFVLSDDGVLKKSFLFSVYLNFYTLSWTVSFILSNWLFAWNYLATGAMQMAMYLATGVFAGKPIQNLIKSMKFKNNKNWWLLISASLLFSVMLIHITVTGNNIWYYSAEELFIYIVFLLIMGGMYVIIFKTIMYMQTIEEQKVELLQARIYESQIAGMKDAEESTRRARHDMRHHNLFLLETLSKGNTEEAIKYLSEFEEMAIVDSLVRHCENNTANSILTIFENKAKAKGINFSASVKFSEDSMLHHQDITVLFSNMFENAINGVLTSKQIDKFISVSIYDKLEKTVIICKNNCKDNVAFNKDGIPINLMRTGIGISSIVAIVEKYEGQVEFSAENNVFTCCVIL
ncbi:MAG: GHKL domain-containing protein [Bacillota bacterium]